MKRSTRVYAVTASLILMVWALFFVSFLNHVFAQMPEKIRIGLISGSPSAAYQNAITVTFTVKGSYELVDLAALPGTGIIATPALGESWQVHYLPGGLKFSQNGTMLDKVFTGPVAVREISHDTNNRVSLVNYTTSSIPGNIGKWYRGSLEFRSNGSSIVAVNELPLEEYLYGVVGKELSDSWPIESLKAQAAAARTYAVYNYSKRVLEGYNLVSTTSDQAYEGVGREGSNVIKAVQETAGKVILYGGKPIGAFYHSTSGGHTENNENVWTSGSPISYLQGKPDPYSTSNGLTTWNYTTTIDEVRNKLLQSGSIIAPIKSFQLDKFASGRVKTVIIEDINGNTMTKPGDEFGKLFNPKFSTYLNNTSFMSRFFEIKTDQLSKPVYAVLDGNGIITNVDGNMLRGVADDGSTIVLNGTAANFYLLDSAVTDFRSKAPSGSVVFAGHGWGHGVGMSQWGAYQMALQGKTYTEILTFYYTGVEVSDY